MTIGWQFHGSVALFGSLITTKLQPIQYQDLWKHLPTNQSHIIFEEHTQWELIGAIVKPKTILFGFPGIT